MGRPESPKERKSDIASQAQALHRRVLVGDLHTHHLLGIGYLGYDLSRPRPSFGPRHPLRNFFDLVDLARAQEGGVDLLVYVLYVAPSPFGGYPRRTERLLERFRRYLWRNAGRALQAATASEIESIRAEGKIALVLAVEGAHCLGGKLANLERLREAGAAYLTLTHFVDNEFSPAATHPRWLRWPLGGAEPGLTARGREAVRELNRLGILVDATHSTARALADCCRLSRQPVILSHTGLRHFVGLERMAGEDEMRRVADTGGVVGLLLSPLYLKGALEGVGVADVVDNLEYAMEVIGAEHVAIGSDFDAGLPPPRGVRDLRDYPAITAEMVRRGFDEQVITGIWAGNFLRVLREAGR